MIFGLKNIPFELQILLNDDIETPTAMIGKKMVPILQKDDGSYMAESMDIVHYVDQLDNKPVVSGAVNDAIRNWLEGTSHTINLLTMPRTPHLPLAEFATEGARAFYTRAKTEWVGDFQTLIDNTGECLITINQALNELEPYIQSPDAVNGVLSEDDFHLFAALRVLSAVKGVVYPAQVDAYRQKMSELSHVRLLDDVAL